MSDTDPILLTGSNGHLGQALLIALAASSPGREVHAVVRSERAASQLLALPEAARPRIHLLDYADEEALCRAGEGSSAWVHLVGILKETRQARYTDAHERASESLVRAAEKTGAERLVSLSILGAAPDSANACLASKGRADAILLDAAVPATVLRLPMVLGAGEIAAVALRGKASAAFVFLTGGGRSMEQPIDTRDVVAAIRAALCDRGRDSRALDLAGPEALPNRRLVERVAAVLGTDGPRVVPLPLSLVRAFASVVERISENPPLTTAMLGVLEHDDDIDPGPVAAMLGIELTPLDETLRATFAPENG